MGIKKYLKKNSIPWFHKTEQNIQFYPRIHSSGYIIVAVALRQSTHIREHISDKAMSIPTSRISMKNLFWWKKIDPPTSYPDDQEDHASFRFSSSHYHFSATIYLYPVWYRLRDQGFIDFEDHRRHFEK